MLLQNTDRGQLEWHHDVFGAVANFGTNEN